MPFKDRVVIEVTSGKGGDGIVSFRREYCVPFGGPNGGDGGQGGSVYVVADRNRTHLGHLNKQHYRATHGRPGEGSNRTGEDGKDVLLSVPIGTQVWEQIEGGSDNVPDNYGQKLDAQEKIENHRRYVLKHDLTEDGQQICIARGGKGGVGNARYATSTNRAPQFRKLGAPGEIKMIQLRLRLAAQFGLMGAPNAGKSSLLDAMTNAAPKIANYAFTTLEPQIGITKSKLSVIDIPGLIEGASQNRGLGHAFLDHIAKCKVLVCVLDASEDPLHTFGMLLTELKAYDGKLVDRVKLVVLNKCDLIEVPCTEDYGIKTIKVSALTGEGIDTLQKCMMELIADAEKN